MRPCGVEVRPSGIPGGIPTARLRALLLGLSVAGSLASQSDQTVSGVHREVLSNGLVVQLLEEEDARMVHLRVTYRVGASDEEEGRTGLAHMVEHAMFLGTAQFGFGEYDRIAEGAGARVNAVTDRDETALFATARPEALEILLRLEADRMNGLEFDPARFRTEKGVIALERRQQLETQSFELGRALVLETLFDGDSYGWPILGRAGDVAGLGLAELREFHQRHYGPNRAVLTIGGAIQTAPCLDLVRRYFGGIPPIGAARRPVFGGGGGRRVRAGGAFEHLPAETLSGQLVVGFVGPASMDPDFAAVELLAEVLVDGPDAVLPRRLVEQQSVVDSVELEHDWTRRAEPLLFRLGLRPGADDRQVRQLLFELFDELASEPLPRPVIEAAARSRSLRRLRQRAESLRRRVELAAQSEVLCQEAPDHLFDLPMRWSSVGPEDLRRAASRFLDVERSVSVFTGKRR